MNLSATQKIDKEISELNDAEIKKRIEMSKNQNDRDFWIAIQDRALQARQKKITEGKFIRWVEIYTCLLN